jgi:hypothetical protein
LKILRAVAAALPLLAASSAALAQSYSGHYLVTVNHSTHANGTRCLTLTDTGAGTGGFPQHAGTASITNPPYANLDGEFTTVHNVLIFGINHGGDEGESGSPFVFSAHAANRHIATGNYGYYLGGEGFDSGAVAFTKGGCRLAPPEIDEIIS